MNYSWPGNAWLIFYSWRRKVFVTLGALLDLARTVDAGGIAVKQQTHYHRGGIGCLAATILLLIRRVDGAQIKFGHHIDEKPSQVGLRKPIVRRWGNRSAWLTVSRRKFWPINKIKISTPTLLP